MSLASSSSSSVISTTEGDVIQSASAPVDTVVQSTTDPASVPATDPGASFETTVDEPTEEEATCSSMNDVSKHPPVLYLEDAKVEKVEDGNVATEVEPQTEIVPVQEYSSFDALWFWFRAFFSDKTLGLFYMLWSEIRAHFDALDAQNPAAGGYALPFIKSVLFFAAVYFCLNNALGFIVAFISVVCYNFAQEGRRQMAPTQRTPDHSKLIETDVVQLLSIVKQGKAQLKITLEELKTTTEELKTAAEELKTTFEELKTTVEELKTMVEEKSKVFERQNQLCQQQTKKLAEKVETQEGLFGEQVDLLWERSNEHTDQNNFLEEKVERLKEQHLRFGENFDKHEERFERLEEQGEMHQRQHDDEREKVVALIDDAQLRIGEVVNENKCLRVTVVEQQSDRAFVRQMYSEDLQRLAVQAFQAATRYQAPSSGRQIANEPEPVDIILDS